MILLRRSIGVRIARAIRSVQHDRLDLLDDGIDQWNYSGKKIAQEVHSILLW